MREIKCILFDMDNTLIDRQLAAYHTFVIMLKRDFPGIGSEAIEEMMVNLLDWDGGGHTPKDEFFNRYFNAYDIEGKTTQEYLEFWLEELPRHTVVFPESYRTLEYLRAKYRLGMITNGYVETQRKKLASTELRNYFETVVISGELGIHKPDKRVFLEACQRMKVEPNECLYVGDGLVNDVEGSLGAGMRAVWIEPEVKKQTELPCQRIYQIQDLIEIL